jgi:hypothetical protein
LTLVVVSLSGAGAAEHCERRDLRRQDLRDFYSKHDSAKVSKIAAIQREYSSRELAAALTKKYGEDPRQCLPKQSSGSSIGWNTVRSALGGVLDKTDTLMERGSQSVLDGIDAITAGVVTGVKATGAAISSAPTVLASKINATAWANEGFRQVSMFVNDAFTLVHKSIKQLTENLVRIVTQLAEVIMFVFGQLVEEFKDGFVPFFEKWQQPLLTSCLLVAWALLTCLLGPFAALNATKYVFLVFFAVQQYVESSAFRDLLRQTAPLVKSAVTLTAQNPLGAFVAMWGLPIVARYVSAWKVSTPPAPSRPKSMVTTVDGDDIEGLRQLQHRLGAVIEALEANSKCKVA